MGPRRQGIGRQDRLSAFESSALPAIDDAFVLHASRVVDIHLTAEQLRGVIEQLRRTAELAALVNAVQLEPDDELGPTWQP
jgi:hypothetical protein